MSTTIGGAAAVIRQAAERLRQEARRLDAQAERLDVARRNIAEADVLTGPDATSRLADLTTLNETIYYQDGLRQLERLGFAVRGVDPAATLLSAMSRSPRWRHVAVTGNQRTGVYQRVA